MEVLAGVTVKKQCNFLSSVSTVLIRACEPASDEAHHNVEQTHANFQMRFRESSRSPLRLP